MKKYEYMNDGCKEIDSGVSQVSLINALANYYKHFEEWSDWEVNQSNRFTIEQLSKCGINNETSFPMWQSAQLLSDSECISDLGFLGDILVSWRSALIVNVKNV